MNDSVLLRNNLIFFIILLLLTACSKQQQPNTLFRQLTPEETGIDFNNELIETEDFNIIEYLYYYNGGGVAIGDINNDGLPDIFFTANQAPNKLYVNKGGLKFEDITKKAGITEDWNWKTGVTMADVNGDGWLDIYVCQVGKYKILEGRNQLYINNQDGTFTEKAQAYGLDFKGFSTQATFFDYDRDGDLDMYLLNHSVHAPEVYGEANLRSVPDSLSGDRLYRNDNERFTNVTSRSGIYSSRIGYGLGVAVGDLNEDGWADLYVCNDFRENDYLYYNNGDGTFSDGTTASLGHTSTFSMGCDIADFNNDGLLDIMSLDMKPEEETVLKSSVGADPYNIFRFKLQYGYHYQYPRNMLQLNRGKLNTADSSLSAAGSVQFSEIAQLAGVDATDWSWSTLFCDLDNDGWKDIFISNGIWQRPNDLDYLKFISTQEAQQNASNLELARKMPSGKVANYAYRNKGDLTFEKVAQQWGLDLVGSSNGAAYADLDNDGDLDLVSNNLNAPATIFENKTSINLKRNYLKIKLKDEKSKNKLGIGARVYVRAGGHEQVQELYATRGFQSASEPVLLFGLDTITAVNILIRWADGQMQNLDNVKVNQTFIIKRNNTYLADLSQKSTYLLYNITGNYNINFLHQENNYQDFDQEKLLPHMLSTQGPKLALGDVNGDGLEDFYMCGAAGQPGMLYRSAAFNAAGRSTGFEPVNVADFEKDAAHEDVDATFFDADSDGDLDLYIVSGGGESGQLPAWYQDRLYVNDGKGNFTKNVNALPEFIKNGSCVVAADFNNDNAVDLFVGSRSLPGAYGVFPDSYLLLNDKKGKFYLVESPALKQLGMVTDAAWLAKERSLIVVGEWMPVTNLTFEIKNSKLVVNQKSEIVHSNGWWNTVHAADLDEDGDEDLLLGNAGLNSTLKASLQEPVELYVGDFDKNQYSDPILTYFKQNKRYTYYSKDELFAQLISIKKKFLDYAPFAQSTFEQVFDAAQLKQAQHQKAYTLASLIAENQGNGQFTLKQLPIEAQFSPIFAFATGDFNQDHHLDILAVGNWYDVQPSMGRYDASYGILLQGNGKGNFTSVEPQRSGFVVTGQGRDIKILPDGRILVARNNAAMQVFSE
ncbi:MAG: VCBS repeat-containing protein [Saprospiraceae bacterium]